MQAKLDKFSVIPMDLLTSISGGKDDNPQPVQPSPPTVTVVGGGNASAAGGAVIGSIPINPSTTAMPYVNVNVNSVNGVTGGGAAIVYRW